MNLHGMCRLRLEKKSSDLPFDPDPNGAKYRPKTAKKKFLLSSPKSEPSKN